MKNPLGESDERVLKKLQSELEVLTCQIQAVKNKIHEREKVFKASATGVLLEIPKEKRGLFVINASGIVETNAIINETNIVMNNVFTNSEDANNEALRRRGQEFIRHFAMCNNTNKDWRKVLGKTQYNLTYDKEANSVKLTFSLYAAGGCDIYFESRILAELCVFRLQEQYNDKELKIIFSVIEEIK